VLRRLRRRVESSDWLAERLGRALTAYLRRVQRTTDWQTEGLDELREDLCKGPVLYLMWHQRSLMGPFHWPHDAGELLSLHDPSPIGRVGGVVQRRAGLRPVGMGSAKGKAAAAREVLRLVRSGCSIGIAVDGPTGPARHVRDAALEWARATQCPVHVYAFATRRKSVLGTWDSMILPKAGGKGALVFRKLPVRLARKTDAAERDAIRQTFRTELDAVTERAEQLLDDGS